MRPFAVLLWCAALLSLARPADCAQTHRLDAGARIRFDAPSFGGRLTGTLVRFEFDTLVVGLDGDAPGLALMIPVDSITRIEVRRERRMTLEGAGLGVLAGTLLAVLADPNWLDENGNCTTLSCAAYKISPHLDTRIAVLAGVGALVGTIVGSETKTARWIAVQLEQVNVGATPDGGLAFGVRLSLRFGRGRVVP